MVIWRKTKVMWTKVNTKGSHGAVTSAVGAIHRDHHGSFIGGFSVNLWKVNVSRAKITTILITIEKAAKKD